MTVQQLITKLQEFPPEAKVDFTADMGFIGTDNPAFELVEDGSESTLYVTID